MKVIVGAGGTSEPGWLSLNESDLDITSADQWARLFQPGTLEAIVAEHVWEHLTTEEGIEAARNCYRYLRHGGTLRIAVPDELHPGELYWQWCAPVIGFNRDDHKVFYSRESLCAVLASAGFRCEPREFFDQRGMFFSDLVPDGKGSIKRTGRTYPNTFEGSLVSLIVGAPYTSLIVDGVKS